MPETIKTKIRGTTKRNEGGRKRQEIIEDMLSVGDDLIVEREPDNPVDRNAIAVYPHSYKYTGDDEDKIGYLSAELAEELAPKMDGGYTVECDLTDITGGDEKSLGVNICLRIYSPGEAITPRNNSLLPKASPSFVSQIPQPVAIPTKNTGFFSRLKSKYNSKSLINKIVIIILGFVILCCLCSFPLILSNPPITETPTVSNTPIP